MFRDDALRGGMENIRSGTRQSEYDHLLKSVVVTNQR